MGTRNVALTYCTLTLSASTGWARVPSGPTSAFVATTMRSRRVPREAVGVAASRT
jgi:hypothetical protein